MCIHLWATFSKNKCIISVEKDHGYKIVFNLNNSLSPLIPIKYKTILLIYWQEFFLKKNLPVSFINVFFRVTFVSS